MTSSTGTFFFTSERISLAITLPFSAAWVRRDFNSLLTFSFIIIRFIVYKFCCLYGNCFLPGCIWRNFSFRFLSRSTDMFLLVRYSSSLIRRMEGMPVWVSVWFTIQPSMKFSGQRLSWWMTSPMQPCTSMLQTVIRQQVRLTSSATR